MKYRKRVWLEILITTLFVVILLPLFFILSDISKDNFAQGESGDSDVDIEMNAEAGGLNFTWNQIHNFSINESGHRIDDPFNVTVCEYILEEDGTLQSGGHIFGKLNEITWDEIPEPSITIGTATFAQFAGENNHSLDFHILGEYCRENGTMTEPRQVYVNLTMYRPNSPPVAVVMITESELYGDGNWTGWKKTDDPDAFNEFGEIEYYIDSSNEIFRLYLNASVSSDPDNDTINKWYWDIDNDGSFGILSSERALNVTIFLIEGDHLISLMVYDGFIWSEVLEIQILIRTHESKPDLRIERILFENIEPKSQYHKGDRMEVYCEIQNVGDAIVPDDFNVIVEYSNNDTENRYHPIWNGTIQASLMISEIYYYQFYWDTGSPKYDSGIYYFRVRIDTNDSIAELRELNNQLILKDIYLHPGEPLRPDISIQEIHVSTMESRRYYYYFINVTVSNSGNGTAKHISLQYYTEDTYQYTQPIDYIKPNSAHTYTFFFDGDLVRDSPIYFK